MADHMATNGWAYISYHRKKLQKFRRSQEEPGGARRARRSQEEPGGAIPVLGKLVKLAVTIGVGWHSGAFHG